MATLGQLERFCKKVAIDHGGPLTNGQPCWLWQGAVTGGNDSTGGGYGKASFRPGSRLAHRWLYEAIIAGIGKLTLDHLCRRRLCVNPAHLEPVSRGENVRRGEAGLKTGARQRAKTHCPSGHPYDAENTYVNPAGARNCRECERTRSREYQRRKRALERVA